MGRMFEKRKHKMFARYDKMAKTFTKIGKEIAMAVKEGGPDPDHNSRLRQAISNAKGANMPKDRVESAIKRAVSKDSSNFDEMVYEGYGPFGVAILVETATDNSTRTVANVRMHFNRCDGQLGTSGSLNFVFDRKGVFRIDKELVTNPEEFEFEFIDYGLSELEIDEDEVVLYTDYGDFGKMQKALEQKGIETKKAGLERIPTSFADVDEDQLDKVLELIDRLEEDDDVQAVYSNLK